MAYAKKYPHIKYKDGVRGKHGVAFETLSKLHKRFLLEHPNVKDFVKDEQKLKAVLGLFRGTNDRHKTKLFYDWVEGDLKKIDEVYDSYRSIDWTCAISGRPIKSKMGDFSARNFVHPEYWDALEVGINQSVLKSSLEFRQKCQQLLLNEQKELMKVFKKNANPRKRLD